MGVSGICWWVRAWLLRGGSCPTPGSPLLPLVFTLLHGRSFFFALALATSLEMSPVVLQVRGLSHFPRQGFLELSLLLYTIFSDGQILALPLRHHRYLFDLESGTACSQSGVPGSHFGVWAYWETSSIGAIGSLHWDCVLFWHCVPGYHCIQLHSILNGNLSEDLTNWLTVTELLLSTEQICMPRCMPLAYPLPHLPDSSIFQP